MRSKVVVAAVITSFCLATAAYACSCPPPPPPEKAMEQAAAVFSGKVLKIAEADEHHLQVTFQIAATWKGTEGKQVVVLTGKNDGICGLQVRARQELSGLRGRNRSRQGQAPRHRHLPSHRPTRRRHRRPPRPRPRPEARIAARGSFRARSAIAP